MQAAHLHTQIHKAYRLRGDAVGLKQAVLSVFDYLVSYCLQISGIIVKMTFYFVALLFIWRTSEMRQAADAFLADIVTAFDKLDTSDKLPAILCEANDLIKLPYLVPHCFSESWFPNQYTELPGW